jgi:hypothetical protein
MRHRILLCLHDFPAIKKPGRSQAIHTFEYGTDPGS